jgi:hypothetical protein
MITYVVLIFTRLLNYGTVLHTVQIRYRSDHTEMNGTVLGRSEQRFGSDWIRIQNLDPDPDP